MEDQELIPTVSTEIVPTTSKLTKNEVSSFLSTLDQFQQPSIALNFLAALPNAIAKPFLDLKKIDSLTDIERLKIETKHEESLTWIKGEIAIRLKKLDNDRAEIDNEANIINKNYKLSKNIIKSHKDLLMEAMKLGNPVIIESLCNACTAQLKDKSLEVQKVITGE